MKAYVGITDFDWYRNLSAMPEIDEVNFWRPGGKTQFHALERGGMFLFKLRSPRDVIVGGGFFAHFTTLPCSLAWEAFGQKNGVSTFPQFREKIAELKHLEQSQDDYVIGCILLEQPFFFPESEWFAPPSWKPNIVSGKTFDLGTQEGLKLWHDVQERLAHLRPAGSLVATGVSAPAAPRYGEPILVSPRLGQGSFRVMVTDAYERRCAASGERTLPVLEAAHIKPYSGEGDHDIQNGLLLRSDLHTLYDRGYLTVTPDYRLEVSRRIREEFQNGREYYALHGKLIDVPKREADRPRRDLLEWHATDVFRK
jgi:putative restriction endonuclease